MELQTILRAVDRRPFEPFAIELDNGRKVTVRHPENLFFFPSRAKLWHILAYDADEDAGVEFHPSAVSNLLCVPSNGGERERILP